MLNSNELEVESFEFENFRLIPEERLLLREDEPVNLPPKAFDALLMLIENEGRLIKKDEFLEYLWADTFVEESTLTRTISTLRKALGETSENKFIETVPKSGYRFVAPVKIIQKNEIVETSPTTVEPRKPFLKEFFSRPVLILIGLFIATAGIFIFSSWNLDPEPKKKIESIAVLPFQQIGTTEENEILEFGIADTLITRLSSIEGLVIRPTSAVSKYVGQENDTVKIGRELKVDAVLEGNIQRSGERIRVNMQLISIADGSTVWTDQFDSNFTNIFTVQDSISRQTVRGLSLKINGEEKNLKAKNKTENAEAYRLYMTGRYFWNKRTVESLQKSIEYYEKALKEDSQYALAYTGLADSYQLLAEYLAISPEEGFTKAKEAAIKALEIDDQLAEAYTSLGYTLAFYNWDWKGAEKAFKRALELNPNYATAHQWYGEYLAAMGRFDEAKAEIEMALKLDPTSSIIQTDLAACYFLTRKFDKAVQQSKKVIEMNPNFAYGYVLLWFSLGQKGEKKEAAKAYIKSMELFGEKKEAEELQKILDNQGVMAMWQKRIQQAENPAKKEIISPMWRALFYVRTGDKEKALDWFEKSYENKDRWIINLKYSPEADSLRSMPRFQSLVKKIGI